MPYSYGEKPVKALRALGRRAHLPLIRQELKDMWIALTGKHVKKW